MTKLRLTATFAALALYLSVASCSVGASEQRQMCDNTGECYATHVRLEMPIVIHVVDQMPEGMTDTNGKPLRSSRIYGATIQPANNAGECFIRIRRDRLQYLYHELMHCTGWNHD